MSMNELGLQIYDWAKRKGWWPDEGRTFGDLCTLMHTEISEAYEDYRDGHEITEIWYEKGDKPCGIPTELADLIIRILDTCAHYGIDIDAVVAEKMAYNETRAFRHGGKRT